MTRAEAQRSFLDVNNPNWKRPPPGVPLLAPEFRWPEIMRRNAKLELEEKQRKGIRPKRKGFVWCDHCQTSYDCAREVGRATAPLSCRYSCHCLSSAVLSVFYRATTAAKA